MHDASKPRSLTTWCGTRTTLTSKYDTEKALALAGYSQNQFVLPLISFSVVIANAYVPAACHHTRATSAYPATTLRSTLHSRHTRKHTIKRTGESST